MLKTEKNILSYSLEICHYIALQTMLFMPFQWWHLSTTPIITYSVGVSTHARIGARVPDCASSSVAANYNNQWHHHVFIFMHQVYKKSEVYYYTVIFSDLNKKFNDSMSLVWYVVTGEFRVQLPWLCMSTGHNYKAHRVSALQSSSYLICASSVGGWGWGKLHAPHYALEYS